MGGLFKFIGDILKPFLTVFVTLFLIAVAASVFHEPTYQWITEHLPVWERVDPLIQWLRDQLGLTRPEERPWWRFW